MGQDMKQLVLQTVNGDMQAFEALYRLSSQQVYYTCLSFVRNEQDAADLMQEAYVQALTHLSTLRKPERFIQWISQIAANKCRNYLMKKQPALVADEILEGMAVDEEDLSLPENYVTDAEKRKIIMNIMKERLSVLQYETVILYYYDGLSIEEIAECMECPAGTVGYRLSAARAKIKQGVLEYEEENGEKLHCYGGFVFLTALLTAELQGLEVPNVFENIMSVFSQTVGAKAAKASAASGARGALLKTARAKIIAGAVSVAVLGGVIAAVAVNSSKSDDGTAPDNGALSQTADKAEQEDEDKNTNGTASDGIHMYVEGFDPSKRWLTMQDFSDGQLSEAPADAVFLKYAGISEEGLAMPVDMEKMLTILNEVSISGSDAKGVELLTCTDVTVGAGSSKDFSGYYYDENSTWNNMSSAWNFSLYNYSDSAVTLQDCFAQNIYYIYDDTVKDPWKILGFTNEEVGFDADERNYSDCYVKTLDMMVEKFGSPHIVQIFGNSEDMENAFSNLSEEQGLEINSTVAGYLQSVLGEGSESYSSEVYDLAWVFDEYVILVSVQEFYQPSSKPENPDKLEIINFWAYLYSRDLYDIMTSENKYPFNKDNQIEELFPDGFLITGDK